MNIRLKQAVLSGVMSLLLALGGLAQEYNIKGMVKVKPDAPMQKMASVAVNSQDKIYIADKATHAIHVFDSTGKSLEFIQSIKTNAGSNALKNPLLVCFDKRDKLYIYDEGLQKILVKPVTGNGFVFGEKGSARGQLGEVISMAVDGEGYIYLLNKTRKQIDIYTPDGNYLTWIQGETNTFKEPIAIGITGYNELYVLDKEGPVVFIYDSSGLLINTHRTFAKSTGVSLTKPGGMAVMANGDFFIFDEATQRIGQFNRNAVQIGTLGTKGASAAGTFVGISALACSQKNQHALLILDADAQVVQMYQVKTISPDLTTTRKRYQLNETASTRIPVSAIACAPAGVRCVIPAKDKSMLIAFADTLPNELFSIKGKFSEASAVACDQKGLIYVLDRGEEEIVKFDAKGTFISKFGGDLKQRLKDPSGLAIQSNGTIVVADHANGNIHAWNELNSYQRVITAAENSGIDTPLSIHVDSKDQIYIWDENTNAIYRAAASGWPVALKKLQVRGESGGGKPGDIGGFFVDPIDQIHVLNKTNGQIEIYTWDIEPQLVFSQGFLGEGINGLKDAGGLYFDEQSFMEYVTLRDGSAQKAFRFRFTPPTPDDQYSFDIQDSLVTVFFSKHPSRTIDSYGLIEVMENGHDSLIQTTTGTSFVLPKEKGNEITGHYYKIVSISHGNLSEPTAGFENHLTYADRLAAAGRFDEALEAYQLAATSMAKGGRIRDYTASRLAASGKLLASRSEATKALQFLRLGFSLSPDNTDMRNAYSMGYAAYFGQMAERDDFAGIITEADRMMSTPVLKTVIMQAIDSVANDVARKPSVNSINNAIGLEKQLIAWEPTHPGFHASLANAYLALYTIKRVSGDPVFELEAALKDADKHASQAVDGLRKNKQPYFREQLIHLEVLNAAGRFSESEKQAFAELSGGANGMSTAQIVQYRRHLAEAYAGQGKHDLAVLEFERILTIDPANAMVKRPMAASLIETKQYDRAREVYQQLLLNDRDNAKYIAGIGLIELRKGNYAEASFQLEKACKKDPSDRSFYGPLAEAYQAASNYQKSIDNYQIAILFEEENLEHARDGFASARQVEIISKSLERYLENCAVLNNQIGNYEKAIENYNRLIALNKNNAEAYYGLGKTSLGAGHIYDAINAFSAACRINPANTNYADARSNAIAERDRIAKDQPNLTIQDVYVRDVFPSLYRNYSDVRLLPLGEMVVSNNTGQTIAPTSIRVFVPDIMDVPTEIKSPSMVAYSNTYVSLSAIFKEKILSYSTEEKLQLEVTIDYMLGENAKTVTKRIPFVVHGRNAITWSDKRCVGAFVSPAVDVLVDYNKKADHLFRTQHTYGLNKSILKAMQLFTLLRQSGITYSSDPSRNYALVSTQTDMLDYLQYPSETLKRKSGDCDDLVVLFAALLENGGVNAAFVDVPGHVFLAFESGIEPGDLIAAGLNELDVIIANDKVWIPLETTLLSTHGFMTSWKTAADRYYEELKAGRFPELVSFSDARKVYVPSNYIPEGFNETPPNGKEITQEYGTSILQLLAKTKREVINEMESRYLSETNNVYVKNKYASLLAQIGEDEKAEKVFLEALELAPSNPVVLNNLGNLYFLGGDAKNAIEYYERASKTDSFDGEILINLCKAYLLDGDRVQAGICFDKAVELDPQLDALYANLKNEVK